MGEMKVEKPSKEELDELGVDGWGMWEKEVSEFPWTYDDSETCYILEGNAEVTAEDGAKVEFGEGDLVTFPKGMSCTWKITKPIRKRYAFGLD